MHIDEISERINKCANDHGFWEIDYNVSEKLMLTVGELAEAQEADRNGKYTQPNVANRMNSNEFVTEEFFSTWFKENIKNTFEDELADAMIRIMDLARQRGIDIEKHIELKVRYNESRPYKHGKKY